MEPSPQTASDLDLARYINSLRRWGRSGWTQYDALRDWATTPPK